MRIMFTNPFKKNNKSNFIYYLYACILAALLLYGWLGEDIREKPVELAETVKPVYTDEMLEREFTEKEEIITEDVEIDEDEEEGLDLEYTLFHGYLFYNKEQEPGWLTAYFDGAPVVHDTTTYNILICDSIRFYHNFVLDFSMLIPDHFVEEPYGLKEMIFIYEEKDIYLQIGCMKADPMSTADKYDFYTNNWQKEIALNIRTRIIESDYFQIAGNFIDDSSVPEPYYFCRKLINRGDYDISLLLVYPASGRDEAEKYKDTVFKKFPERLI